MSTQLAVSNNNFLISPKTLSEAMDFAKMISDSSLCPPAFKSKPGDVLIAMQMGAEVGLSPLQALQNIAVINGRPCIWGDAALAIVQTSSVYLSHREWFETEKDGTLTAYCAVTRKGQEEYVKTFSQKDAERAGLWKKAGVWQQYPSRMLQMRARAFAIRDKFADALRGLNVREEVEDYKVVELKPKNPQPYKQVAVQQVDDAMIVEEQDNIEIDFVNYKYDIENAESLEDLQSVYSNVKKKDFEKRQDLYKQLVDLKDAKKSELQNKSNVDEFLQEYDTEESK